MALFLENHQTLLIQLLESHVEFIVAGGYAVIYHGYLRNTGDLDLWLNPDNKNKERLISLLKTQGVSDDSLETLANKDFTKHLAFHYGNPPERTDFMTTLSGITFKEAISKCNYIPLQGLQVPVLSVEDLILTKIASGRLKDQADVEAIQQIQKKKKNK